VIATMPNSSTTVQNVQPLMVGTRVKTVAMKANAATWVSAAPTTMIQKSASYSSEARRWVPSRRR
jgi:hypothetical protein